MSRKKITISNKFSERLVFLMRELGYKNRQHVQFANKIGITNSFLSDVLNLKSGASFGLISGIADNFSQININWLLTGKGEMVLEPEKEGMVAEYPPIYNKEEKPAVDEPDHELKNKLIKTQDKLISQMELIDQLKNRLAETEKKLKLSEEIAVRIRENDTAAQRGDVLKKKAM